MRHLARGPATGIDSQSNAAEAADSRCFPRVEVMEEAAGMRHLVRGPGTVLAAEAAQPGEAAA